VHEIETKPNAKIIADIPTGQIGRLRIDNSSRIEPQAMTALSAPLDAPPWDIGFCSRQARLGVATVIFTSTTPAPSTLAKRPELPAKETFSKGRQA
jgi:hypothetical protein